MEAPHPMSTGKVLIKLSPLLICVLLTIATIGTAGQVNKSMTDVMLIAMIALGAASIVVNART